MATTTSIKAIGKEFQLKEESLGLFRRACELHLYIHLLVILGRARSSAPDRLRAELSKLRGEMRERRLIAAFTEFERIHPIGVRIEREEPVPDEDVDAEADDDSDEEDAGIRELETEGYLRTDPRGRRW